jgi:hypothetical protein
MKKQEIISKILNHLPSYNSSNPLDVKITKGNPITLEHYIKMLNCVSRKHWNYVLKNSTNIQSTKEYLNVSACRRIKEVLQNNKALKKSNLQSCLDILLNFKNIGRA